MSEQILISHSSKDNESAQRVKKVLEDNGFSCWLDNDDIPPGADYIARIAKAMRECNVVVVLVSKNSESSKWVKKEVTTANDQNKLVIPYMLQDFQPDDEFSLVLGNAQRVSGYGSKEEEALRRVITAIHDYINDLEDGEEIKITIEKNPKKKKALLMGIAGVLILSILLAIIIPRIGGGKVSPAGSSLEVYYSELLPYTKAGYYQTANDGAALVDNDLSTDLAFSILSFIRNQGDSAAFVEQIRCDISSLKVNESPVPVGDIFIKNNHIKGYIYNDGWGTGTDIKYSLIVKPSEDKVVPEALINALETTGTITVEAGSAVQFIEADLPTAELKELYGGSVSNLCKAELTVEYGDHEKFNMSYTLQYEYSKDEVSIFRGGKGDSDDFSITLYALLDVDQNPSSIRFTGDDATPLINDTFRIETVIIPTKSCDITCKGVYSVGGKLHETEEYSVSVTVPVFRRFTLTDVGTLTTQLFELDFSDTEAVNTLLDSYRYDPASILERSK